jgi:23S rRNA pseudouridine1911/1915/1917 synthase
MGKDETSLAEILAKKYPEIKTVGDKPEQRPGIVHRLDKEASGLIVVARTQKMFNHLKKQFKAHTINKEYLALAHGRIDRDCDEINFPITRSKNTERMSAIPSIIKGLPTTDGKLAATEFEVVKRFVNFTLLKVKIHTGRTHQIRVHLFAYNHPLVGDPLYFSKKQKRKYDDLLGRLFLHSAELSFIDLQKQEQTFKIDLPDRLKKFLNEIV